jgi:hypothetical protein
MRLYYQVQPDYVWLAPPCKKWSPLQRLAVRSSAQAEFLQATRNYEEHAHLAFTSKVFRKQQQGKRHGTIEQLQPSAAWETTTFQQTPGYDFNLSASANTAQHYQTTKGNHCSSRDQ